MDWSLTMPVAINPGRLPPFPIPPVCPETEKQFGHHSWRLVFFNKYYFVDNFFLPIFVSGNTNDCASFGITFNVKQ